MPDEIVGRGTELAAVERFVERARSGLSALVLEGDAGIGKTTIWEAAVRQARIVGFTVLTTGPARSEHGLTLGGLTDLLTELDADVLAGLPHPQRHALEVALLRVEPSGSLPDQRALSVAVAGVLRLLSARMPVLIAVDDAQWLDESSASIVAYAIRRLADRPLGLLVSVRTGLPAMRSTWRLPSAARTRNGSRLDRCRSHPSTGSSSRGSAGRCHVSRSSGSRLRPAATLCTRSRSPARYPKRVTRRRRRGRCRSPNRSAS